MACLKHGFVVWKLIFRIDAFTDASSIVKRSMSRLGNTGKLRSVVIDITFDHMLTKNWDKFYNIPLRTFLDQFYHNASFIIQDFPDKVKSFIESVIERDRLGLYTEPNSVLEALYRIDDRLSERLRKKELASSHFTAVQENYNEIETDFLEFYPLLSEHVNGK